MQTLREEAMARIRAASDAIRHPKSEDEDSDTPSPSSDEVGESAYDRNMAARKRLNAMPNPKVEPDEDYGRPVAHRALDSFIEKNPQYAEKSAFNEVINTALHSMHDDVYRLREKFNKTDNRADCEALFARAAEITPGEKAERERRSTFEEIARDRLNSHVCQKAAIQKEVR
jgi:G3E family GTPase